YTFEWKDRVITLCLVYLDGDYNIDKYSEDLHLGYSVKLPTCTLKEQLPKDISLGRATCKRSSFYIMKVDEISISIKYDKSFLKTVAKICERNIKQGKIVIKGIR